MNNRGEEENTEGSHLLDLPELDEACLGIIAAFMDPNESALVSKAFLKASGETALDLLTAKVLNHTVDDLSHFITQLVMKVPGSHPRLLLPVVGTIPIKQRSTRHIGPSVVLPDGNIATVCAHPDNMIRILDTQSMTIVMEEELGFVPVIEGPPINFRRGPISWSSDRLLYSNGYLVLHRRPYIAPSFTQWIHVWKLEGQVSCQFLYSKAMSTNDDANALEDVAVAADSTMYVLSREEQGNQKDSYKIESFALATGQPLNKTTIQMPNTDLQTAKLPYHTNTELIVAGAHLLVLHHLEEPGPYPNVGLGIYSFSRVDLSQCDFLPCFEDHETDLNHDESGRTSQYVLSYEYTNVGDADKSNKKISISGTSGKLAQEDGITFETRFKVVLATPRSVFTINPDEEILGRIGLDEYDLESGKKLRTLETGVPLDLHMVASVLASEEQGEVFILISGGATGNHIVQSFLL